MKRSVRQFVASRSRGVCERCGRARAMEVHHRLTRARGGTDEPSNLAHLCAGCHREVHDRNEHPWIVAGYLLRGVYYGDDEEYRQRYPGVVA